MTSDVPTTVLINPKGGTARQGTALADLQRLLAARLPEAHVVMLAEHESFEAQAHAAYAAGSQLIVACGGDGTINAVAQPLVGTNTWLGVLPLGTLNHFAQAVGIPLDLQQAVDLLRTPQPHRIDVGRVNDRYFLNNASLGLYPQLVELRDQQWWALSKRLRLIRAAWHLVWTARPFWITFSNTQRDIRSQVWLVFVGNNRYRLDPLRAAQRRQLDDAELDVIVLHTRRQRSIVSIVLAAQRGHLRTHHMTRLSPTTFTVEPHPWGPRVVAYDGETAALDPPFCFQSVPQALWVVAPTAGYGS